MKEETKISSLGTINLTDVSIGDSQLEIHIPIDSLSGQFNGVLEKCTADYMKKHKNVKSDNELCFDVSIILYCGGFAYGDKIESNLSVIAWQQSDEENKLDTSEYYNEIPVILGQADVKKLQKIIWCGLGQIICGL